MGDDESFDDDGDVANVADRFSDEIIGYDVEDVVDVNIADEGHNGVNNNNNNENKTLVNGDSSNNNNSNGSKTSLFAGRRWILWVGLSMVATFAIGIALGNTRNTVKGDSGSHPPVTFGNPAFGGGADPGDQEWGPGNVQQQQGNNLYGDIPNNSNQHMGAPSTEEDIYLQRKRHFTTLVVEWSGAAAVATPDSPSRRALDWILDEDPFRLTTADRTLDVQQRYIMAVFYFATLGEHWASRRRTSRRTQQQKQERKQRQRRLQRQIQRQRRLQTTSHEDLHDSNNEDGGVQANNNDPNTDSDLDAEAYFLTYRDVCHWSNSDDKSGVFCDENGVIVRLEFRDFGLGGTLPREVGFFSNLSWMNLEYNDIEGSIPTHYGLLVNLQNMKFENNQITGRIPSELSNLQKLEKLDLDGNYFTGLLPTELAGLKSIVKIEIGGSTLRGSIPTELSNLSETLQKLDLKDNNFSGNIPSQLGSLTKLNYLDLENNKLSGAIPTELRTADSLEMLYLNGNDFAGSLDAAFCNANFAFFEFVADCRGELPEVKCSCCTSCCDSLGSNCSTTIEPLFDLSTPTLKPTVKPTSPMGTTDMTPQDSIVDSSKLKQVLATISDTSLLEAKHTDQFKAFMWMTRLDPFPVDMEITPHFVIIQKYIMALIYVSTNGKEWDDQYSFFTDAGVCDWKGLICNDQGEIVSIILEKNNLDGTIVSEIGALGPSLRELQLGMNMLHGELPSELGLLSRLTTLDVFGNNGITGTVPSDLSLQFLPDIEKIQLVGTSISGNMDPLFCDGDSNSGKARDISANCFGPAVSCSCCQVCCDEAGDNCRVLFD